MDVWPVVEALGIRARRVRRVAGGHGGDGNANWHVWPVAARRCVLRQYHARATVDELDYEHAVTRRLAAAGWTVPEPLGAPLQWQGRWFCLTEFVPGRARRQESPPEGRQRGADLARLQLVLRPLADSLGQRPRWRAQHEGTTVHTDIDWDTGLAALADEAPRLAAWAADAAESTAAELTRIGASALPVTLVHGDFAEWNVHYDRSRLAGVLDFGLSHLDSRPYELAIARTYRTPEVWHGYREELAHQGWPLSELEEASIEPIHHAFRIDMVAWQLDEGRRTGHFDTDMIARQLERTGFCASRKGRRSSRARARGFARSHNSPGLDRTPPP